MERKTDESKVRPKTPLMQSWEELIGEDVIDYIRPLVENGVPNTKIAKILEEASGWKAAVHRTTVANWIKRSGIKKGKV